MQSSMERWKWRIILIRSISDQSQSSDFQPWQMIRLPFFLNRGDGFAEPKQRQKSAGIARSKDRSTLTRAPATIHCVGRSRWREYCRRYNCSTASRGPSSMSTPVRRRVRGRPNSDCASRLSTIAREDCDISSERRPSLNESETPVQVRLKLMSDCKQVSGQNRKTDGIEGTRRSQLNPFSRRCLHLMVGVGS